MSSHSSASQVQQLTIGLIINPWAGVGGAVGLKGSDGVIAEALARGATPKANDRVYAALENITDLSPNLRFIAPPGLMGGDLLQQLNLSTQILPIEPSIASQDAEGRTNHGQVTTTAADTRQAAIEMLEQDIDLLIFAGGDGTARDICAVVGDRCPVLGIPAGVKIHSSVFAITPAAAGEVLRALIEGKLVDIREAEVRDLDEQAFRQNQVRAKHFGDMRVPQLGHFVQSVKQGGVEDETLVLLDIAATLQQEWDDEQLVLVGSGKTTQALMDEMGLDSTLLGVDAVYQGQLVAQDATEAQLWQLLQQYSQVRIILSVMGGQGHIIGRGNQQFSPRILAKVGKHNLEIISSKTKIIALQGRPLIIDSGDQTLDRDWRGSIEILTGYQDRIVYPLV